jgi:hypothetical protein
MINLVTGLIRQSHQSSSCALLLALSISWISLIAHSRESSFQKSSHDSNIKFSTELMGRGTKRGALYVSFANYAAQDGVQVRRNIETYRSAAVARKEAERMVGSAVEVVERGAKGNATGKRIGERFVYRRSSRTNKMPWVILWRQNDVLYVLESNSLRHLKAFEDQVYPTILEK